MGNVCKKKMKDEEKLNLDERELGRNKCVCVIGVLLEELMAHSLVFQ